MEEQKEKALGEIEVANHLLINLQGQLGELKFEATAESECHVEAVIRLAQVLSSSLEEIKERVGYMDGMDGD